MCLSLQLILCDLSQLPCEDCNYVEWVSLSQMYFLHSSFLSGMYYGDEKVLGQLGRFLGLQYKKE